MWLLDIFYFSCLYGTVFEGVKFLVRVCVDIYQNYSSKNKNATKPDATKKSNPMAEFLSGLTKPKTPQTNVENKDKLTPLDKSDSSAGDFLSGILKSKEAQGMINNFMKMMPKKPEVNSSITIDEKTENKPDEIMKLIGKLD